MAIKSVQTAARDWTPKLLEWKKSLMVNGLKEWELTDRSINSTGRTKALSIGAWYTNRKQPIDLDLVKRTVTLLKRIGFKKVGASKFGNSVNTWFYNDQYYVIITVSRAKGIKYDPSTIQFELPDNELVPYYAEFYLTNQGPKD
jgi:hypothetical protein